MSKKWYNYFVSVGAEGTASDTEQGTSAIPPTEKSAAQTVAEIAAGATVAPQLAERIGTTNSFEEIYQAAEIHPPAHGYTVYKVAEMLQNPHIRDLAPEIRRSSVLVALEAAGVKPQEIVEDAVRRDKALDVFERVQRKAMEELESKKTAENRQVQADIDRMVADYRARIQTNSEAIAREKERFNSWLLRKQQEEARIADTVAYFVSENPITVSAAPDIAGKPTPVR
jgi:hypothetical protein